MSEQNYRSLDDLVFENRNKEYGAYDLRMKENSTLMKAFLIGTITSILILGGIVSYNTIFNRADDTETVVDINLENVDQPEIVKDEPEPPPPPDEPEPEPEVATVKMVIPEPKPEPKKEETVPEIKQMENKLIGLENKEGTESNSIKSETKPEPKSEGTGTKPAPVGNFTARQVSDMAIYPGCEKFKGDKANLQKCLSDKLNDELGDQLTDFAEDMSSRGETQAVAKLQFVIDKSGKIIQVQAMKGGSAELGKESEKALQRIASKLSSRGKAIQPAKLEDGSPVNLVFQLPVKYQVQ